MAKIDRLGWAAGTCFVSYGVRVGIRVNKAETLNRLREHLPPGFKPSRSPVVEQLYSLRVGGRPRPNVRHFNVLYSGVTRRAWAFQLDTVLETLEADLRLDVASNARRRIFVHAGVVGWRGRAIVIPGRSFSGKTTLVAELLRAGADYYSDEFAVLDGRGRVHPFPKPLSLRRENGKSSQKLPAKTLGSLTGEKPLPVGAVVLTRYRAEARWRPAPVTPGRAMLALLANTVPARRVPERSLAALEQVVARASVLKGERGEAREMVDALLTRFHG